MCSGNWCQLLDLFLSLSICFPSPWPSLADDGSFNFLIVSELALAGSMASFEEVLELKLPECSLLDTVLAAQKRARYWSLPPVEMIRSSSNGMPLVFLRDLFFLSSWKLIDLAMTFEEKHPMVCR